MKILSSHKLGYIGEKIAVIYLFIKGYKILKLRYKNYFGEIDIIAQKGTNLVAIEVKTRNKIISPLELVTNKQKGRIKRSFLFFLSKNNLNNVNVRFDMILVSTTSFPKHFKNFWN